MSAPESGKVYRLTGEVGIPAISNGNTWAESEVRPSGEECIDAHRGDCSGTVEDRPSLTGTGLEIPRCEHHYAARLRREDGYNRRYGRMPRGGGW